MLLIPKNTSLIFSVSLALMLTASCNNEKSDDVPPAAEQTLPPEQMPMKKLESDSSADMPVVKTPDSTANMPNPYDSQPRPK